MTDLVDPLRTLRPLREEEVAKLATVHEAPQSAPLAYDVYRVGDELVMEFDAPGVTPEDIDVTIEGRTVVVSLRRTFTRGPRIDVIESGRQHGAFCQRLLMGSQWDLERLDAHAENGVLSLRAPMVSDAASRRVHVTADRPGPSLTPPWEGTDPVASEVAVHTAA
jgi:HSP20 family protein